MPAAVLIPLITTAATAGAGIYAANKQSGAASDSAKLQTDAANHGADVQGKAAADALAFEKQQAEAAYQAHETDRKANYDQWAALEARKSQAAQAFGYGPRNVPAYVPSVDPRLNGGMPSVGQAMGAPPVAPPPAGPPPAPAPPRTAMGSVGSYLQPAAAPPSAPPYQRPDYRLRALSDYLQ